ncbi:hypothetical protein S7711_05899, partial [Stachybotrys chartarum IBT 7711]
MSVVGLAFFWNYVDQAEPLRAVPCYAYYPCHLRLVGAWYHVQLLVFGNRGLENWLYTCFAIWVPDRLLRIFWRVWENHPFSVVRTSPIRRAQRGKPGEPTESTESSEVSSYSGKSSDSQAEKGVDVTVRPAGGPAPITTTTGLTLYVKKFKGMTKYFQQAEKLTTLIEGPYSDRSHDDLMLCDKLVCFGGGVGITGVLPLTAAHSNAKVYWNMKESDSALAADLTAVTDSLDESEVRVGQRFDVHDVLDMESSG